MKYCSNCGAEVSGAFCSKCGTKVAQEVAVVDSYEKDQLLNLLYMLRAGISYISLKYDELQEAEDSAKKTRELIFETKKEIDVLRKESRQYEKVAKEIKSKEEVDLFCQEHQEKMKIATQKDRRDDIKRIVSLVFLIVFGALSVLMFFPVIGISMHATNEVSICLILAYLIIVVIAVVSFIIHENCDGYERYREEKRFEEFITNNNNAHKAKSNLSNCLRQIDKAEKNIVIWKPRTVIDKEIMKLPKECEKLYTSLVDTFGDVLNPQDWKNLDTIIYCLETNRANTLKEALQQSDLVVRHEELKTVIYDVGMKICATVIACTSQLSMQLEEVSENQRKIAVKLQNMNENILSASEMQEALLKKANQNSKQIMEDVHKMREYSHTRAIRDNISL